MKNDFPFDEKQIFWLPVTFKQINPNLVKTSFDSFYFNLTVEYLLYF